MICITNVNRFVATVHQPLAYCNSSTGTDRLLYGSRYDRIDHIRQYKLQDTTDRSHSTICMVYQMDFYLCVGMYDIR